MRPRYILFFTEVIFSTILITVSQNLSTLSVLLKFQSFIIPLLEQTRLQYKRYKAERMKLYPCE